MKESHQEIEIRMLRDMAYRYGRLIDLTKETVKGDGLPCTAARCAESGLPSR